MCHNQQGTRKILLIPQWVRKKSFRPENMKTEYLLNLQLLMSAMGLSHEGRNVNGGVGLIGKRLPFNMIQSSNKILENF